MGDGGEEEEGFILKSSPPCAYESHVSPLRAKRTNRNWIEYIISHTILSGGLWRPKVYGGSGTEDKQ